MYPMKYWFKIGRILFALSVNGETGANPKKPKDPSQAKSKDPNIETTKTDLTTAPTRQASIEAKTKTLTLDLPPSQTLSPSNLTPSAQDVRVGWIYGLSKTELTKEMQKFNLETSGTVEEMRRIFRDFLRQGFTFNETKPVHHDCEEADDTVTNAARGKEELPVKETTISSQPPIFTRTENFEGSSVREMLGLPSNTEFKDVQRLLSSLLTNFQHDARPQAVSSTVAPTNTTSSVKYPPMSVHHHEQKALSMAEPFRQVRTHPIDVGNVCNQVRKWNLRFDGNRDPISFLERLNELIESYEIDHEALLKALPELFRGQALYWYRNNKESWNTYGDFIRSFEEYFLPPDYVRNLDAEIVRRTQGEQEPFRNFVVALNMLMRRKGNYSKNDLLNRLFMNMRPEYKLTIRREQFESVSELMKLAEGHESYLREKRHYRPPPPPAQTLFPEAAFTPKNRPQRPINVDMIDTPNDYNSPCLKPNSVLDKTNLERQWRRNNSFKNHAPYESPKRDLKTSTRPQDDQPPTCWNCEKVGHRFFECRLPKIIRCYNCKTVGVRTVLCPCRQGNGTRDQRKGGTLSLEATKAGPPPTNGKTGLPK